MQHPVAHAAVLAAALATWALAPAPVAADTVPLPPADPIVELLPPGPPAVAGRVINRAPSCGAALRADARFDFRRSTDGMGAGSLTIKKGKSARTELAPGTYDVRVYLFQRKAYRYLTTRHLVIEKAGWEADFGCVAGSTTPALQHRLAPTGKPRLSRSR